MVSSPRDASGAKARAVDAPADAAAVESRTVQDLPVQDLPVQDLPVQGGAVQGGAVQGADREAASGSDASSSPLAVGDGSGGAPWMRLAGSGLELAASTLLLGGGGYWLDGVVGNSRPYLAVAGVLLGFSLGLYRLILLALRPFDGGRRHSGETGPR